ncbi:MAG: metal ABC transporter substrate-binding protein [Gemmatimonadota bacterium]|nr:metal ABC transporter substrate-binding protein [Gemmatimonadota bacterium]MDH5758758.1 metal ABC transporter substrate-binding protein [Gemmatimonadota bacterium]
MTQLTHLVLAAVVAGTPITNAPAHSPEPVPPPPSVRTMAPVKVVATLPIYASIAQEIGGAEVEATWVADPNEDSHFVRPKPSYALQLRNADLFITTGLDLEMWVPALLDKAGNRDVLEGGRGYVTAYTGVTLLDIPVAADRSAGDVHIFGNPHLHTDPLRTLQVARNIATGLKRVAPDRSARFDAGLAGFQDRVHRRLFGNALVDLLGGPTLEQMALNGTLFNFLDTQVMEGRPLAESLGGWLGEARPLRGLRIICYHKNWTYFEDRFGVECADYVEAKPGIPPTPRHVAHLIDLMRGEGIDVLLAASYFDSGRVTTVAERGEATPVIVPMYNGARPGLDDYFDLVDLWVGSLVAASSHSLH